MKSSSLSTYGEYLRWRQFWEAKQRNYALIKGSLKDWRAPTIGISSFSMTSVKLFYHWKFQEVEIISKLEICFSLPFCFSLWKRTSKCLSPSLFLFVPLFDLFSLCPAWLNLGYLPIGVSSSINSIRSSWYRYFRWSENHWLLTSPVE